MKRIGLAFFTFSFLLGCSSNKGKLDTLGVEVKQETVKVSCYRVLSVPSNSFAKKLGLKAGDQLALLDLDKPLLGWSASTIDELLKSAVKKDLVVITVSRNGKPMAFMGVYGIGVRLGYDLVLNPGFLSNIIVSVKSGSPAERYGLKVGDVVLAVNGKPVSGKSDVIQLIKDSGDSVNLKIKRDKAVKKVLLEKDWIVIKSEQ